jgi:hypothetical protein
VLSGSGVVSRLILLYRELSAIFGLNETAYAQYPDNSEYLLVTFVHDVIAKPVSDLE